jgi:uncharacterized membrane protein YeaQ/YmgE (transglycosylase-associated protein family)
MIGAVILGIVAGALARLLIPNDAFENVEGWKSLLLTVVLGLVGAMVGYGIFRAIGVGDDDMFDLGGIIGAVIGSVVVLLVASFVVRRTGHTGRTGRTV